MYCQLYDLPTEPRTLLGHGRPIWFASCSVPLTLIYFKQEGIFVNLALISFDQADFADSRS